MEHGVKLITIKGKKVPTELRKFRQATLADVPVLESLVTEDTINMFGQLNFPILIENSAQAMIGENSQGNVVFFICMFNHPDIPSILPELWEDWMEKIYYSSGFHTENTRFVRCILYNNDYDIGTITKAFLQNRYLENAKLKTVCLIRSPCSKPLIPALMKVFSSLLLPVYQDTNQVMHYARRHDILPELITRMACPSDNDDIMTLLERKIPNSIKLFGEFYVAETLYSKNENIKIIVGEIDNQVVGFIWLHSDVDLDTINKNYEVYPFETMRKHYPGCETFIETHHDIAQTAEANEIFEAAIKKSASAENETPEGYFINEELKPDKTSSIFFDNDEQMFFENFNKQLQFAGTCPLNFIDCQKFLKKDGYLQETSKTQKVRKTDSDVFAIEMCVMSSTLDDRMSIDLIKAAFNVFDTKSHCVCSFPNSQQTPAIVRYFTRITHRYNSVMKDISLYITHKNVIVGRTSVRRVEIGDLGEVKKMLRCGAEDEMKTAAEILKIINETYYAIETKYDALIIQSEGTTIGLIILCVEDNVHTLMKYFDIEEIFNFEVLTSPRLHGRILYFYLHPLFESRNPYIFLQIFSITEYNIIYYYNENFIVSNVHNNVLADMLPVRPRKVFNIHDESYSVKNGKDEKTLEAFPIYYQNIRRAGTPKKNCDMKIIITGAFVYRAIYETLFFNRKYQAFKFNNMYALTMPGTVFAQYTETNDIYKNLILNVADRDYLKRVGILTWVSFIFGTIKHILRPEKTIILDSGQKCKYDALLLLGRPHNGLPVRVPFYEKIPINYMPLNFLTDVHNCRYKLHFLNRMYSNGFNIIVYGIVLQAYTCISFLLQEGIKGENIYLVMPSENSLDDKNVNPFTDDFVEKKLFETFRSLKVNIYKSYDFLKWNVDSNNSIKYATFESKFECVNIYCDFFMSFIHKVSSRLFRAVLLKAGLVFDGSLVIDEHFRTNDPHIYCGGYLAKYKRGLLANKYRHWYYDGDEVTSLLMKFVLEDKQLIQKDENDREGCVPEFKLPLVFEAIFPYNLYYYTCKPSGFCLPYHVYRNLDYYGIDLITGRDFNKTFQGMSKDQKGYFHIHLNKKGFIKSITCLSKKKYSGEFFYQIWGCHEKLFSNLRSNYDRGLISDFHEFFSSKWSLPIINNRLRKFHRNTEKYVLRYLVQNYEMKTLVMDVIKGKRNVLTETEKDQIRQCVRIPAVIRLLEVYFKHYIQHYSEEFNLPSGIFHVEGNCKTLRS